MKKLKTPLLFLFTFALFTSALTANQQIPGEPSTECAIALGRAGFEFKLVKSIDLKLISNVASEFAGDQAENPQLVGAYSQTIDAWLSEVVNFPVSVRVIRSFKDAHIERWRTLDAIARRPDKDFPIEGVILNIIGANPKMNVRAPNGIGPKPKTYASAKRVRHEMDVLKADLERLTQLQEPQVHLNQAIVHWKLRAILQGIHLDKIAASRERIAARKAQQKEGAEPLGIQDLLGAPENITDQKLLDAIVWALDGSQYQPIRAIQDLIDSTMERSVGRVQTAQTIYFVTRNGLGKIGQISHSVSVGIAKLRSPVNATLAVMALYVGAISFGNATVEKSFIAYHRLTTETEVLVWEDYIAGQQTRKVEISDKANTYEGFGSSTGLDYQLNRSDDQGRVAREYVEYWIQTGKTVWKPSNPADEKFLVGMATMINDFDIQMFAKDIDGRKIVGRGAQERIDDRRKNIELWVRLSKMVEDGTITGPIPIPDGVRPNSPPTPTPSGRWKLVIAADKSWKWTWENSSAAGHWVWDNVTSAWNWVFD